MSKSDNTERITRDQLEGALRDLQGDLDDRTTPLLTKVAYGAGAAAGAVALLSYVMGRRSGRKRSTIVEVRRL